MNILHVLTSRRRLGNLGEDAAARFLKRHRYKILERNYVGKRGEIDIIASKKQMMVFVEVKTRNAENSNARESRPAASVDSKKQRRLIHVANEYARRVHKSDGCMMRMDIIEVYTETVNNKSKIKKIVHIENAFNMNSAYKVY
jgi:putative endonuclease